MFASTKIFVNCRRLIISSWPAKTCEIRSTITEHFAVREVESGNHESKRFELGKQERRMFFFFCFPVFLIQVPIPRFLGSWLAD
jgi:hypothetical protein